MATKCTPKDVALVGWRGLKPGQNPLPLMRPIPYKTAGSKYGCCGIRIDGTPEFVDAVLSNLKSLIDGENGITRLELTRRPVEAVTIQGQTKGFENREQGAEVCYIRLHERGHEAKMINAHFGIMREETKRHAASFSGAPAGLFE